MAKVIGSADATIPKSSDVARGFSLVPHDPEGSHYETWSATG
jgi:hypothetical protein